MSRIETGRRYFLAKAVIPADIPQKNAPVRAFLVLMQKKATQSRNQISTEMQKTLEHFLFQNGIYNIPKLLPDKNP